MVGTLHVDAMLDELTPKDFDEWIAYRTIEMDPVDRIIEILKRGFATVVTAWGGHVDPDDLDPMDNNDQHEEALSPTASAAMAKQAIARGQG